MSLASLRHLMLLAAVSAMTIGGCAQHEYEDDPPSGQIAIDQVRLTAPDNQKIDVNPEAITTTKGPREVRGLHFPPSVQCVVYTADGKFAAVIEDCDTVWKLVHAVGNNRGLYEGWMSLVTV